MRGIQQHIKENYGNIRVKWHEKRTRQELNPQPFDPKSNALSIELLVHRIYYTISVKLTPTYLNKNAGIPCTCRKCK